MPAEALWKALKDCHVALHDGHEERAKAAFFAALDAYVDERIRAALEGE